MVNLKDYIVDKYLTWKTGKDKPTREWEAWYEGKVNYRAGDITNMFDQFKHIIVVDPNQFFQFDPFAWVPCEDAKQFLHPNRKLGDNAVWRFERVTWNEWDRRWHIDSLCGEDKVFVATNNDRDAMVIALKYAG